MALLNCPECGKEISDKALYCPNCGCPIEKNIQSAKEEEECLCCPRCRSKHLHSEKQGFNVKKAYLGNSLWGKKGGVYYGAAGSEDVRITCLKCGHQFKPGEAYIYKGKKAEEQLLLQIAKYLKETKDFPSAISMYQEATNCTQALAIEVVVKIGNEIGVVSADSENANSSGCVYFIACIIIVLFLLFAVIVYNAYN